MVSYIQNNPFITRLLQAHSTIHKIYLVKEFLGRVIFLIYCNPFEQKINSYKFKILWYFNGSEDIEGDISMSEQLRKW